MSTKGQRDDGDSVEYWAIIDLPSDAQSGHESVWETRYKQIFYACPYLLGKVKKREVNF